MSDKRNELQTLAQAIVQRSGLRELSFRQLAEQAGVKSSSVHYYFPEKHDLTAALISSYSQAFAQQLQAIDNTEPTLRRKLMAFVNLFEEAAVNDRLCLCGMLAAELSSLDTACRDLLETFFKHTEGWLGQVLKHHQAELVNPLPPDRLAAVLMSGLEGALLLDRVHGAGTHLQAQRQLIRSFATNGKG
jgi:TetR/AcrR family transcriptional regulator, transcriptional repressor for nem operon